MRIGECHSDKDLLAALEAARERRMNARRGWEIVWWNNLALVAGDHYATWDPMRALYVDRDPTFDPVVDAKEKKPRMVINHALSVARTELSKLTKSRPITDVIANSDSPQDLAAVKVGRSALDYAEWKFKLPRMRKQALWWMIQCGLGAVYVGWDAQNDKAGQLSYIVDPATGDPTFSPVRKKEIQDLVDKGELDSAPTVDFPLGELEFKVYSPFQLYPDETALDWDEISNLITTEVADVDVIQGMYGRQARDIQPEQVRLGTMEERVMQRAGWGNWTQNAGQQDNACYIHTFWLVPNVYRGNGYLENGKYVRWCQNRIIDASPGFPFQDGRMPFVFFQHIPQATSIWPDTVINHIRGPNLEVDKIVSQLIEAKDYMANPMWRVATQQKVKGQIKAAAGSILRYVHVPNVPPPEPIQGLQLPAQVESLLAGLREQIMEISGQSEVAHGNVPTGVRSGVAVAYLQEEDDTKIAPTIENMEYAIALEGSLTLERFSQFYVTDRIISFYRPDGRFDAMKFKGSNLKDNTQVICQAGSAMPRSKAAKQQYTLELVSLGILTDPEQIEEMLDLGSGAPSLKDMNIAQANRENNIMLHGLAMGMFQMPRDATPEQAQQTVSAAVPVKAWQDHATHIEHHTMQMMDEEFDKLQVANPGIVRLFDEHVAMHQKMMADQQAAQAQALEAAKGAPESAGGVPAGNGAPPPPGAPGMTRQNTAVPDIIGGGQTQLTARRTPPLPSGRNGR
jgi:hypothetical protein